MTAFRATFSDLKVVKTRQVAQLIFEIPLADFDGAYEILGGLPNPAVERWVAIAAIAPSPIPVQQKEARAEQPRQDTPMPPSKPDGAAKRDWRDLPPAQQAGIRCDEPSFAKFLKKEFPDEWHDGQENPAECVRLICQVRSRKDLATNHRARVRWSMLDSQYEAWFLAARVGA